MLYLRLFCEAAEDTGETRWASQSGLFFGSVIAFTVLQPGGHHRTLCGGIFVKSSLNSMGEKSQAEKLWKNFWY
jgi:hypothetical protein